MSKDIILAAGFVASGLGATGLTVTVDVWRVTLSNLSASEVVTAGSATEIGDGLYAYRVASADLATYYYYAIFKTSGTADVKHLFGAQLDFSGNTGDSYARLGAPAGASVSADVASVASTLSTVSTNVSTALNRIGAFTGSGLNTILGFLKAMASKAAALTPSDMGGTYDNTTDALEAIKDAGATISDGDMTTIAGRVWNNTYAATRTLTQSAASVAAALSGSDISIRRGDTVTIALTGLGSLASRTQIWLTLKADLSRDDSAAALVQVSETGGLLYLNGAAAGTAADGSLTVTDADAGNLSIVLKHGATKLLSAPNTMQYDVQILYASGTITTLTAGTANVVEDVTKRVS